MTIDNVRFLIGIGMTGFIGYAIASHLGWIDGVASSFAIVMALRAMALREARRV